MRRDVAGANGKLTGYVEGLFVRPAFRGRNVAVRLLRASQEWARGRGCVAFASDRAGRVIVDRGFEARFTSQADEEASLTHVKYQLVIQFPVSSTSDFDDLSILEENLSNKLGDSSIVDGHDFGSEEFNIFVLTEEPVALFQRVQEVVQNYEQGKRMRVAYREISGEGFVVLWPLDSKEFKIV